MKIEAETGIDNHVIYERLGCGVLKLLSGCTFNL